MINTSIKKQDAYKSDSRKTGEKPPLGDPPNLDKSIFLRFVGGMAVEILNSD